MSPREQKVSFIVLQTSQHIGHIRCAEGGKSYKATPNSGVAETLTMESPCICMPKTINIEAELLNSKFYWSDLK